MSGESKIEAIAARAATRLLGRVDMATGWSSIKERSVSCNHKPTYVDIYGITLHLACATKINTQVVISYFYILA